ncbi:helix-turn-helix domain-containing protein [Mycolicibacterium diernhoferi]|uniref:Transcriptional regulator n=1 Tax=Mycolicibacterium diernhoferi TaxID=1801 RepID=A0A1Q4HJ75_9MYCO|nr:helix-turn-helix domain-containing protein [Mycolicibacterium diernhoferi]OJZ67596.1 transcriptional regulator [Mycolicibacterium diernhoferi]OPE55401.1 transcriptional regulator [Mycolicibacterium diernhoferi]PEG55865.1 XRE family transcriptional regulator [Mycolicibacterium diernhoferi]QYL25572.1 helix-turn-helix domain-containing protein [Mycolicibacterium diernhoferi]
MPTRNATLAEFLRQHRAKLQPSAVGLPEGRRRRVTGLRREEVASLAGISPDYYHRIEQGRERPSDQVLDAIARTLLLSPDATAYLRNLAANHAARQPIVRLQRSIDPALQDLIDNWYSSPASIYDGSLTAVMANGGAAALSDSFAVGGNPVRSLFLDERKREFYRNWDGLTAWAVRGLRDFAGHHPDPRLDALIDELHTRSAHFRKLWATYDVRSHSRGLLLMNHPQVGPLDLHFQHLGLRGSDHIMVVYWADPGSPSEVALRALTECRSPSAV